MPIAATAAVGAGIVGAEAYDNRQGSAKELEKQTTLEEGHADGALSAQDDTAKFLVDENHARPSSELASIPAPLSKAESGATLGSSPLVPDVSPVDHDPASVRPTASVITTPGAPAARAASTTAVKNAELVSTPQLGGLESEGAHETGHLPKVIRHDTDISVSRLHVPGQFK